MRTPDYVGIALLYMVAITRKGQPAPTNWDQLADAGKVAVPDPKVAASALGALAYFGTDFYADLQVQGRGPGEYARRCDHRCRPGSLRRWDDHRQFGVRRGQERLAGDRVLAEAGCNSDLRAGRGVQDHRKSPTGTGLRRAT